MNMNLWPDASEILAPLVPWFHQEGRSLPWRATDLDGPHPDPYAVLVSELMLQQTQVATVRPYFERWMAQWPTVADLALAEEQTVFQAWEGLGYYRRARYLHAAARAIHEQGWPEDLESLRRLPGLGSYGAAALAAIAFQQPEAALDGNLFRVLARVLGLEADPRTQAEALREWLQPALAAHGPSRLTQALMDLGALRCLPTPQCEACPLHARCWAAQNQAVDRIPARLERPKPTRHELGLVALTNGTQWLLCPPRQEGLLAGLWQFPAIEGSHRFAPWASLALGKPWIQRYTHRQEHVVALVGQVPPEKPATGRLVWVSPSELQEHPMGKRDDRLRQMLSKTIPPQVPGRLLDRLWVQLQEGDAGLASPDPDSDQF